MALVTNLDTANLPHPDGRFRQSVASFLRHTPTDAYTALDIISDSATPKALEFPNCGRSGAVRSMTISNRLETDAVTPRVFLFDAEPTNFADSGALALVTADLPKLIGIWDFVEGDKLLLGTLINYYVSTDQGDVGTGVPRHGPVPYSLGNGTSIFGLLQTVAGYTPIASTQFVIKLGLETDAGW